MLQLALQRLQQGDSQAPDMLAHLARQPALQAHAAAALAQWQLARGDAEAACTWAEVAHAATDAGLPVVLLRARCLRQAGRHEEAAAVCEAAAASLHGSADLMMAWALALREAGKLERARAVCERALASHPDHPGLLHNLGNLLCALGDQAGARHAWLRCTKLRPEQGVSWFELARQAEASGDLSAASAWLLKAAPLLPTQVEVWRACARVCSALRAWPQALAAQQQVASLQPQDAQAHLSLARLAMRTGDLAQAVVAAQESARLQPHSPEPRYWLAQAHRRLGAPALAVAAAQQALELGAEGDLRAEALYLRTVGQIETGDLGGSSEGVDALWQSARTDGERAAALDVKAAWHMAMGDAMASLAAWQRSCALWPGRFLADQSLCAAALYTDALSPQEQRELTERHMAPHQAVACDVVWVRASPEPDRRLRVAYLSGDFRRHSCAYFLEPLLIAHDRSAVELFAYANQHQVDEVTERLRSQVSHWHFVAHLDDKALRQRIRDDGIDVLIDLSGFTEGGRLQALAQRVAPVQLTWLGYLGTTGLASIDGRVTDADVHPPDSEGSQTEALWRIPRPYLCYRPDAGAPAVSPLPALQRGHLTFGSFNVLNKVSPACVRMWTQLMHRVPGARLVLKAKSLSDEVTRKHWFDAFAAEGIGPDRLELRGWQPDLSHHLQAYHDIDIALDTWPYNGVTTSCEAMWMGVPVLSLCGAAAVARQGRSLLNAVGLPEWCAENAEAWVAQGAAFAGDLAALQSLRQKLRQRMADSPLCDADGFARAFEATLRQAWRQWCRGC